MTKKELGKNIKKAREEEGITQEELAEKVGVHVSYISRIERGVANPTHDLLESIGKILKMKASDLLSL